MRPAVPTKSDGRQGLAPLQTFVELSVSGRPVKNVALITVVALVLATSTTTSIADPPPARPDYLVSLPPARWSFANLLWQHPFRPCEPTACEAGYFAAPFMLSVKVGPSVESDGKHSYVVKIVAGAQNCDAVASSIMRAREFHSLSAEQRHELVGQRLQSAAQIVADQCGGARPVVPTEDLRLLELPSVE
jgi:hypothetical protein